MADSNTTKPGSWTNEPTQEQVQAMVDVWREWSAQTPDRRPSVNALMHRAYRAAMECNEVWGPSTQAAMNP